MSANAAVKPVTVDTIDRGGSVCLNSLRVFSKWFSALVTPLPLRASAG